MKRPTRKIRPINVEGLAALGICESLLLALTDLNVLSERDVRDLLGDVATMHTEAEGVSQTPGRHKAVIAIIERILGGKKPPPH